MGSTSFSPDRPLQKFLSPPPQYDYFYFSKVVVVSNILIPALNEELLFDIKFFQHYQQRFIIIISAWPIEKVTPKQAQSPQLMLKSII